MANKRTLKKTINLICEELFAECVAVSLYSDHRDNGHAMLVGVIKMQNDFLSRMSHPEPGMQQKAYYQKLKEDFTEQAQETIDQIQHLA